MKSTSSSPWKRNIVFVLVAAFVILMAAWPQLLQTNALADAAGIHTFKTMLVSIVLEAIPFLLLGVAVSSLIGVYVPESWVSRLIPKNPLAGVLVASLLGIIFPVCECGLIPVVRRLVAKGMPLYAGVVFFLAGPIVNPIVYSATFVAFRTRPEMVFARMGLALVVAALIGLIVYAFVKRNPLRGAVESGSSDRHLRHHHSSAAHGGHASPSGKTTGKLHQAIKHAGDEFFDMGKYLIIGSFLTAMIQSFVPRSELLAIGQGEYVSHFFMMGFAYVLSLCSTADAFVASSFISTFSAGSLLTFLVFGPMIDLKGTLMLLSAFKAKFVLLIIALVTVIVPIGALLVGRLYF